MFNYNSHIVDIEKVEWIVFYNCSSIIEDEAWFNCASNLDIVNDIFESQIILFIKDNITTKKYIISNNIKREVLNVFK